MSTQRERKAHAKKAAQCRWKDRGGPSTVIRISSKLAKMLKQVLKKPYIRRFVDRAIADALEKFLSKGAK